MAKYLHVLSYKTNANFNRVEYKNFLWKVHSRRACGSKVLEIYAEDERVMARKFYNAKNVNSPKEFQTNAWNANASEKTKSCLSKSFIDKNLLV